jgi:MFS family permease
MAATRIATGTRIETDVTGRLDQLPWSRWHVRLVVALGITWMLDGLEVTLVGSVGGVLTEPGTLHLTEGEIGLAASAYLAGAILGALFFGRLTDSLGRKTLFLVTLAVYCTATFLTGLSLGLLTFALFRFLTGAGIGGEYAAINSAIDELVPARLRGRVDLAINSTYWAGTVVGALATLVLLNPRYLPRAVGWRVSFAVGGLIGFAILLVRRHVPESPRWLLLRARVDEAERVVDGIEAEVARTSAQPLPPRPPPRSLEMKGTVGYGAVLGMLLQRHWRRSVLGFILMVSQAFAYNAIFFTYALILARFYGVPGDRVGLYLLPFALGNLIGPYALGRLFDTIGRRQMIAFTYAVAGVLLAVIGWAFAQGWLTATSQTVLWSVCFFFASAAASSAYLTVSELFPVEIRGLAIAVFYAVGTAAGGVAAPALFGALIQSGSRAAVMEGYLVGAALMLAAAAAELVLGVPSERRSLEEIADPGFGRTPGRDGQVPANGRDRQPSA